MDPSFDKGQVQFIFHQELFQFLRIVDSRQDVPFRMYLTAMRQEFDQENVANGDADAQADRQLMLHGRQAGFGLLAERQDLVSILFQVLAGSGQVNMTPQAFE